MLKYIINPAMPEAASISCRSAQMYHFLRICFTLVVLSGIAMPAPADVPRAETEAEVQKLFNEGNYNYEQKDFAAALDKYRQIENRGIISGSLLLNTGLCYIQLQEVGYAKFYFTKALDYPDVRSRAEKGLQFTEEWLQRNNAILPTLASYDLYRTIQQRFGSGKAFVGIAIFLNLAAIGILLYWFTSNKLIRRFSYYSTLFLSVPVLFLLLAGFYTQYSAARWQPGLVVGTSYMLHEDLENRPEENEFRLMPGTEIMMRSGKIRQRTDHISAAGDPQKEEQDWYYIYSSNGNEGWVESEAIRLF